MLNINAVLGVFQRGHLLLKLRAAVQHLFLPDAWTSPFGHHMTSPKNGKSEPDETTVSSLNAGLKMWNYWRNNRELKNRRNMEKHINYN